MKVKILYIGRRRYADDSISYVFLEGKKERHWNKVKGVFIGRYYFATKNGKNLKLSCHWPEKADEEFPDENKIAEWRALDAIAENFSREKRALAKFNKMTDLKNEITRIKRFVKNLNFHQKRKFVEWLVEELEK